MNGAQDDTAPARGATRRVHLVLALALGLACALRFAQLGAGLRHTPHMDEQYFVRNVARMLHTGSFDHGFYEYPGLLFYLLAPVLALVGVGDPPGASAYLAARALMAALGVLAVGLVYVFGARLAGRPAGLVAALFLAVSTVHVETAHMLRPDVALEAFTLLALVSFLGLGPRLRDDARAGAAAGMAVGLKFSAGLLAVPYLAQRLLRPGPRLRGLIVAGLAGAAVFVAVSPYAVLRREAFTEGVATQLTYHYQPRPEPPEPYAARFLGYASVWPKALGPLGAFLALAGLAFVLTGRPRPLDAHALDAARARRGAPSDPGTDFVHELTLHLLARHPPRPAPRLRDWLPFLLLPPLTAAVFASTGFHFDRHMLPSLGVVALLAGLTVQALHDRWPTLAVIVAAAALAFPLASSLRYLDALARPGTRDRAADWIMAHAPAHARVLSTVPGLALDPERFELQQTRALGPLARVLVRSADVVASVPRDEPPGAFEGLPAAVLIEPQSPFEGPPIALRLVPAEAQLAFTPLAWDDARLEASTHADALALAHDGRLDTYWETDTRDGRSQWLQASFARPVRVARVELLLGGRPHDAGRSLRLLVSADGRRFEPIAAVRGRPSVRKQLGAGDDASEVLLCEPVTTRHVRIERRGGERQALFPRWSVAELRLDGPAHE